MVLGKDTACAVDVYGTRSRESVFKPGAKSYRLMSIPLRAAAGGVKDRKKGRRKSGPAARWIKRVGIRIGAMVRAGDLIFVADKPSLEKMITIFLDNAIKYTPRGGKVTISAKKDKKYVLIKIKDTGIGIPEEDLPHIFDRFYQVERSRSKIDAPGYGLGLALAKRIIEIHKGNVYVCEHHGNILQHSR